MPPLSAAFSPTVKAPFIWTVSKTVNELYKINYSFCFRPELLIIFLCPPVFYVTVLIILRSLVIKGMCHLMPNDHPDPPIVDSIIRRKIKIGKLQNAGRKNDFIIRWIIVGGNGRGRCTPFRPINRLVQFCQLILIFILVRSRANFQSIWFYQSAPCRNPAIYPGNRFFW